MADLKTSVEHKRGGAVKVGGTTYPIDQEGVCKGVSAEHAAILLQNRTWRPAKAKSGSVARTPPGAKPAAVTTPEPEPEVEETEAEEEAEEEAPKPRGRGRGRTR